MIKKAIFLDRDGTIITDKHYLHDPNEVEYLPNATNGMKLLQKMGYSLLIITNQSGIGRGYYTKEQMDSVHIQMQNDMITFGLQKYLDIAFCPHGPDDLCNCRKPHPTLINGLISKWNIDPNSSYMIGDKDIDAKTGQNANIKGCLIRGKADHEKLIFQDLLDFANYIKKSSRNS